MSIEQDLRKEIVARYGSVLAFSKVSGIPASTIETALKKGLQNTNTKTSFAIADALTLNVGQLLQGNIVQCVSDIIVDDEEKTISVPHDSHASLNADVQLTTYETRLLKVFMQLSEENKRHVIDFATDLLPLPKR